MMVNEQRSGEQMEQGANQCWIHRCHNVFVHETMFVYLSLFLLFVYIFGWKMWLLKLHDVFNKVVCSIRWRRNWRIAPAEEIFYSIQWADVVVVVFLSKLSSCIVDGYRLHATSSRPNNGILRLVTSSTRTTSMTNPFVFVIDCLIELFKIISICIRSSLARTCLVEIIRAFFKRRENIRI